jgi:peptide/nickel transport system substrate-binding protein
LKSLNLLCIHEMVSLEPNSWLSDSSASTPILKNVCPGLVTLDADLRPVPDLAQRWTASPDHTTYRFELRDGVRYHSGRPLSPESVAWNVERLFDSRAGSLLGADYAGLKHVRPVGPRQVEFAFHEPFPAFLQHLGWRTYLVDDRIDQPVGAGPFRLVEWQRGERIVLESNREYHVHGRPRIDRIVIRFAPNADDRVRMIEAGEAHVVENVPAAAADRLRASGVLEVGAAPSQRKTVLAFNCMEAPFDDPRLRHAAALAIDRDRLIRDIFGQYGRRVDGIYPAGEQWGVSLAPHPHDPERARALLHEAGCRGRIRVSGIMTNVAPVPRVAARVSQELAAIGIDLDIRGFDDPPWWPFIYLRSKWQIAFQGMPARPHPDCLFRREFASGGAFNPSGYSNPELDSRVARARRSTDAQEQARLYAEAQRLLHADIPVLPLYAADVMVGWRPGVRGVRPHPLGYLNLDEIALDR